MMNESKFLAFYRRKQESRLTVKEFCSNEGIAESTYYYWIKKTRSRRSGQEFIPLVVKSSEEVPARSHINNPSAVHEPRNADRGMLLEVEYRNGTKLRIQQDLGLDHLRTLVCLLD